MCSKAEVGESKQGLASRSRLIFLVGTLGDDLERVIRQQPLQRPRLIPSRAHPDVTLLVRRQDHRHGFEIGLARPPRSAQSPGNRTRDAAQESVWTWCLYRP